MKRSNGIQKHIVKRPWGQFTQFVSNTPVTVKIIAVEPKQSLSLQYHTSRNEFWHILSGGGRVTIGKRGYVAKAGKEFSVPAKMMHRISAGKDGLAFLEIAIGRFDESDIVRIQDNYGRISKKPSKPRS